MSLFVKYIMDKQNVSDCENIEVFKILSNDIKVHVFKDKIEYEKVEKNDF